MGKAEKSVEMHFNNCVVERGGFTRKYTSPGRRGVTDRIMFLAGLVVFVELKTPIGQLSELQKREIRRMTAQGAICAVLNSRADVDRFFEALDREVKADVDRFFEALDRKVKADHDEAHTINLDLLRPIQ